MRDVKNTCKELREMVESHSKQLGEQSKQLGEHSKQLGAQSKRIAELEKDFELLREIFPFRALNCGRLLEAISSE